MRALGSLEAVVMHQMWAAGEAQSVRAVHDQIAADRDIAYTTVMTVMDHLYRKGLLNRERQGRAYVYSAPRSREEYTASLLGDVLAQGGDRGGVLLHFVERLGPDEIEVLSQVIEQARKEERGAPIRRAIKKRGTS